MTVRHVIKPGELGKWAGRLGTRLRPVVQASLRKSGAQSLPDLWNTARTKGIKATGTYIKGFTIQMPRWDRLVLTNTTPYAVYVENGRRAGARQPPVYALVPWVQLVLGVPEARARSVAFRVARAIGRRGIPARPVLGDKALQSRIAARMARVLRADLDAEIRAQLARERR
jgi:hypothetical protein